MIEVLVPVRCRKRPMGTRNKAWKEQTSTFYVFSYFFLHQTLEEGQEDEVREKRFVDSSNSHQQTFT